MKLSFRSSNCLISSSSSSSDGWWRYCLSGIEMAWSPSMRGACQGCPSSTATLKMGIEICFAITFRGPRGKGGGLLGPTLFEIEYTGYAKAWPLINSDMNWLTDRWLTSIAIILMGFGFLGPGLLGFQLQDGLRCELSGKFFRTN